MSEVHVVPPVTAVLVSGGSRGLGLALVKDLLDRHIRVATFARTVTDELRDLGSAHPDRLHLASVDGTDQAGVDAFVNESAERLGPLDGLVNNAAIGQDSLIVHTAPDRLRAIIDTNVTAPLLLTRTFLRRALAGRRASRIVMVTSICAQRGYSGLVAYAASKGALESAARTIAREMHGRCLVNCVAPGFFASEMSAALGNQELETIVRRTPSGRLVEPEHIVPIVRMLLLDDTNMNGQVVTIDGGSTI